MASFRAAVEIEGISGTPRRAALLARYIKVMCSFVGAAAAAHSRHVSCMRRRCPSCSKQAAMICTGASSIVQGCGTHADQHGDDGQVG